MAPRDNIFLIGPMGAGKTTVGKRVAEICAMTFIDSDSEVETRTGVDIPYIFEREGEAGFRKREKAVIADLVGGHGIVLATGGGAVIDADNRRALSQNGYVVYLHASLDQQLARTARSGNRPLLKQAGDRRDILQRLLAFRDPLYREIADWVVETDGRNARVLAREIVDHYLNRATS